MACTARLTENVRVCIEVTADSARSTGDVGHDAKEVILRFEIRKMLVDQILKIWV